jgi:hypothetical protein
LHGWEERGVWLTIWKAFLCELNRKGHLDWSEAFIDGSFASAEKGCWNRKGQAGKGTKWMVVVDDQGTPLGKHFGSASPAEVKLAEITLASISILRAKPESLYPDEPRGRSPLADARVDLNASFRDAPTLFSL